MDGLYSKVNGAHDTRINNWSAARDSVTDFNNNSRGVQGGVGFASDPPFSATAPNPNIFDHGISQGASEALDFETTWAQTIRTINAPQPEHPEDLDAGAAVFEENCASCHGGAKWTKSQVLYLNNPGYNAQPRPPARRPACPAIRAWTFTVAQIESRTSISRSIRIRCVFLEPNIGAFDPANPIEIRQNGAASLGALGLNVPSLLGVGHNAPYFHNGLAQTLERGVRDPPASGRRDHRTIWAGRMTCSTSSRRSTAERRSSNRTPTPSTNRPCLQRLRSDPVSPRRSWHSDRRGAGRPTKRVAGTSRC